MTLAKDLCHCWKGLLHIWVQLVHRKSAAGCLADCKSGFCIAAVLRTWKPHSIAAGSSFDVLSSLFVVSLNVAIYIAVGIAMSVQHVATSLFYWLTQNFCDDTIACKVVDAS